jgi:hypothetical protein
MQVPELHRISVGKSMSNLSTEIGTYSLFLTSGLAKYQPSDALKHKTPDPRYGESHGQRAYRRLRLV